MDILSKEPGYDGKVQGLAGILTLDLSSPFTEKALKIIEERQREQTPTPH